MRVNRKDEPPTPSSRIDASESLSSLAATRQVEPVRLGRFVWDDLDWIVMKALAKERAQRYDSAVGLANDIERFLHDKPVTDGPPTARYQTAKFIRRHRRQGVAATLLVVALVGGMVGTTVGLIEAKHQEQKARLQEDRVNERAEGERRAKLNAQENEVLAQANERKAVAAANDEKKAKKTAEAVLAFVENKLFAAARPQGQDGGLGYDVKLADAITAALPAIAQSFPGKPLVEARLRQTIGRSFFDLGKPDLAAEQFAAARSLKVQHLGPDHSNTLASMESLADCASALGRQVEALQLREKSLAMRKAKLGADHLLTLTSMSNLANSFNDTERHTETFQLREETLALQKAKLGPDHPDTLNSMRDLGYSYYDTSRYAEALKIREEVLALRKAKLGPSHPDTLSSLQDLANTYNILGRHAEALEIREIVLTLAQARLSPDHPHKLNSMALLANDNSNLGRHSEALKLGEEALALQKDKRVPDHHDTLSSMKDLALALIFAGRTIEALPLLDRYATANPQNSLVCLQMATLWGWFGREAEFAAVRRRTLRAAQNSTDPIVWERAATLSSIRPSADRAELDAACALARRAIKIGDETPGWPQRRLALGMAAYRAGDDQDRR